MRRVLLLALWLALVACGGQPENFEEATIADLHDRMHRGELSSEQLVSWYLERIETTDRRGPALHAVIELNPDALMTARALDEEWQESGPRGPMHGIPVILKANIDTADSMRTTAGSLALANHMPAEDAFLVSRLRNAGAVILGKANLSEWANFRSTRSSSGWSSVGGQTKNAYDPARNPCGSSSGSAVAVAANLTTVAVGTETDGSVICPSGINGIVGIKPTLGLISRSGIIPIAHSQDTAGPMARSVRDAAILLAAMTGTDANDPASAELESPTVSYTANLAADGLAGKRIGVIRSYHGAGSHPGVEAILTSSIAALENGGAIIVDEIEIETSGMSDAEYEVLLYEFKADLNAYLEKSRAPIASLADIIEYNEANAATVMPIFGQEIMLLAEQKGPLTEEPYLAALADSKRIAQRGLDEALNAHELDALLAPTNGPAWLTDHINGDSFHIGSSSYAAVSGYPNITVPAGFVAGLPVGLSFMGAPNSDKTLIEIAYAFEQATAARRPPEL
ncbi:MAG: amidase [Gammaproteobacteria bacterium]|nr:amidase [Gammaproteobacteria bacterium]